MSEPMIGEEELARSMARRRVILNMALERREYDLDRVERIVGHAWRDFADDARAHLEALRVAGYVLVKKRAPD